MITTAQLTIATWIVIALNVAAITRLVAGGLFRHYPALIAALAWQLTESLGYLILDASGRLYFWLYILGAPIRWFLYLAIIWELYGLIFKDYPGIREAGRWCLYSAGVIAIAAAAYSGHNLSQQAKERSTNVVYLYAGEITISLGLACLVLLLLLMLTRYPMRLSQNLFTHALIVTFLFLTDAGLLMARRLSTLKPDLVNFLLLAVGGVGYLAWALLLSKSGQEVVLKSRRLPASNEIELMEQLKTINSTLVRVVRR